MPEDIKDHAVSTITHVITEFNADEFREYLEDASDITLEQQTEILKSLWHIMSIFVDIGWGVDGVQMVLPELFDEKANAKFASDSELVVDSGEATQCVQTVADKETHPHD